jgi:putative acetyltransferase
MDRSKIEIRRCEPDDFQAIHAIFKQPRAIWGTLQVPYASVERWRQRVAEPAQDLHWLCACVDDEVVGSLSLETKTKSPRRRHAGELGIAVHDRWHGRGVGSALLRAAIDLADRWLNLARLELTVYADNEPAIRLYRRAGFRVEGKLRSFAYRDGVYADALCMARLRT